MRRSGAHMFILASWLGCEPPQPEPADTVPAPPPSNVLLIVLDDVGKDKVSAYGDPLAPPTPVLDSLAAGGIRFDAAYSTPMCSSTRAEILTGRLSRRTGIGEWIQPGARDQLYTEAWTLPEALRGATVPVASAAIGKWHLVGSGVTDAKSHPIQSGFDHFTGALGNLGSYVSWTRIEDSQTSQSNTYATTQTTDDALAALQSLHEPFFLYLAYNASHEPWHVPPASMFTLPVNGSSSIPEKMDAMTQAVDQDMGRMFSSMDPEVLARTTIIVVGDNGTTLEASTTGTVGKGTVYEEGVNVPLIVSGPAVGAPGSVCEEMVHFTDLFPTIAEMFGAPLEVAGDGTTSAVMDDGTLRTLDGRSILSLFADPTSAGPHDTIYAERFSPNGAPPYSLVKRMLRDDRYKVIENEGVWMFTEILPEGGETDDLLPAGLDPEQQAAYDRLSAQIEQVTAGLVYERF